MTSPKDIKRLEAAVAAASERQAEASGAVFGLGERLHRARNGDTDAGAPDSLSKAFRQAQLDAADAEAALSGASFALARAKTAASIDYAKQVVPGRLAEIITATGAVRDDMQKLIDTLSGGAAGDVRVALKGDARFWSDARKLQRTVTELALVQGQLSMFLAEV
jgi:hypothetical protein